MRAGFLVMVVLATGCVGKKKHDLLVSDLNGRIDAESSARGQCEADAADLRSRLDTTNTALEDANRQLASKMAEAGQLQQDVATMQAALNELNRQKALADQNMAQYRDLVARFQAMIDAGTLKVKVIGGRMVVELATDILFPAGSASLSKEGQTAISEVAKVLASIPGREFQIAGHTDDRPIGTAQFPSNWHLGSARAIAVVDLLVKSGLASDRVSAASFAEFQPADTNRTPEGRAANRRIEIIVVPDLTGMPGYQDLAKMGQAAK
jgi:chemotaxis protein MotB